MSYALALVDNLFFQARIQAVAKQIGIEVKIVPTGEQLVTEVQAKLPTLVIIDLNSESGGIEAVPKLRALESSLVIIGYLAHTQTELAEQAKTAGCTKVMSQGSFTEELPMILAHARGKLEHKSS